VRPSFHPAAGTDGAGNAQGHTPCAELASFLGLNHSGSTAAALVAQSNDCPAIALVRSEAVEPT